MLKYIGFSLFLMLVSFNKKNFWLVQNFLFFFFFFFLFMNFSLIYFYISYIFGLDLLSYGLVILSIWICALMILASEEIFKKKKFNNYFLFLVLFLLVMLIFTFSTLNFFLFYFFFESSLIPIFFLILGWGYQPERLQAGIYLLFYTLFASLPLLICIFFIYEKSFSLNFYFLINLMFYKFFIYFSLIFSFFVKMPMFLVHVWLPKAHVEAPIAGSMILAGVLLKLGGYGLMRVFPFLMNLGMKFNYFFISISLMGGFLISLVCLRQIDFKLLIAYSSVTHMGMVLGGLLTLTYWGLSGSFALMIAHGICSSGLFCLANMSYERTSSRSLLINRGLMNFMPSLSLWWFLLCACNMASPPSLNLMGEISLLNSIFSWAWSSVMILSLMFFFSAAYSLYLFSFSQQGSIYSSLYSFSFNNLREYLLLILHWLPLNLFMLKGEIWLLWI